MTATAMTPTATAVIPYLTASDAVGALAWYTQAFGAEEQFRVVGPDGLLGHAEFRIGDENVGFADRFLRHQGITPEPQGLVPGVRRLHRLEHPRFSLLSGAPEGLGYDKFRHLTAG